MSNEPSLSNLVKKLKGPLTDLSDLTNSWSADNVSITEVSEIIAVQLELTPEQVKYQLTNNHEEFLEIISRKKSEESFDIENMQIEELLEKLRCKCGKPKKTELEPEEHKDVSTETYSEEIVEEEIVMITKPKVEGPCDYLQADCMEFLPVKDYAKFFVDSIIAEAEDRINYQLPLPEEVEEEEVKEIQIIDEGLASPIYLLIVDFNKKAGKDFILQFVLTWKLNNNWSFCIDFIAENSDTCCDFFIYEVKWSLPKMCYPIPKATASVFFTIQVCRVKALNCPVEIYYVFETERYKFRLNDKIRQEEFLSNIIHSKLEFFKTLRI